MTQLPKWDVKGFRLDVSHLGHRTIRVEASFPLPTTARDVGDILADLPNVSDWVMPEINGAPGDGIYCIELDSLKWDAARPDEMCLAYRLNVPVFRHEFYVRLRFATEKRDEQFTLVADLIPESDRPAVQARGVLKATSVGTGLVTVSMVGEIRLSSWLVYHALPMKLLERELRRIAIIARNYGREEERRKKKPADAKLAAAGSE